VVHHKALEQLAQLLGKIDLDLNQARDMRIQSKVKGNRRREPLPSRQAISIWKNIGQCDELFLARRELNASW